jgi:hypothetical protein
LDAVLEKSARSPVDAVQFSAKLNCLGHANFHTLHVTNSSKPGVRIAESKPKARVIATYRACTQTPSAAAATDLC